MASIRLREEVISGPDAPVLLRHLAVRGSNAEIGRAIAELAINRYGLRAKDLLADGRFVRARRAYFERDYPIHAQRMRGVAAAFALHPDDDRFDFSILRAQASDGSADALAAVATYSPPSITDTGHGVLHWTARLPDLPIDQLELYLMEWHPSGAAPASLALHAFDLLSGAVLGINSKGLAVSAVASADVRFSASHRSDEHPRAVSAVGLHELGLLRLVLDTCATVDDAQAALLGARAFRMFAPARYLIADRSGRSFAYESSVDGSAQRIVDGAGAIQSIATPAALRGAKAENAECARSGVNADAAEPFGIAQRLRPAVRAEAKRGASRPAGNIRHRGDIEPLQGAPWFACVVDQEHRSLEARYGPAQGCLHVHLPETE